MTITGLIYWIIKIFEIYLLYLYGGKMSQCKTSVSYWKLAIVPILCFALVEGLRWGHMIDYNVYAERYTDVNNWITQEESSSPVFTIIVYFFKGLGCPYPLFLVFQCGFLIFSAILALKNYREYLKWILPCMIIGLGGTENFIRYFLAHSFVLISYYYYQNNKILKYAVFAMLGVFTHFGSVPFIFILTFSKSFSFKRIPAKVVAALFLIATFIISVADLHFLVTMSNYILSFTGGVENQGLVYLSEMDDIIAGDTGFLGTQVAKFSSQIKSILLYIPIIFIAPKYLDTVYRGNVIYNLFAITIIIAPVFGQVELLGRLTNSLQFFEAILVGITLYYMFKTKEYSLLLPIMITLLYFYSVVNAPFVRNDWDMYFLWDSGGRLTNWGPYLQGH